MQGVPENGDCAQETQRNAGLNGGLAQLRKELQAHRNLLVFLDAAKRNRVASFSEAAAPAHLVPGPAARDTTCGAAYALFDTVLDSCPRLQRGIEGPQSPIPASKVCSNQEDAPRTAAVPGCVVSRQPSQGRSGKGPSAPVQRASAQPAAAAAARPPWRGPLSRAAPATKPETGPDHARPQASRRERRAESGAKPLPRAVSKVKGAAQSDFRAGEVARVLGELAAAAAMSVMAQATKEARASTAVGGAGKPRCTAPLARRGASDPGTAPGGAAVAAQAAAAKGAKATDTRLAIAPSPSPPAVAGGAAAAPGARSCRDTYDAAVKISQALQLAQAGRGAAPTGSRAAERPVHDATRTSNPGADYGWPHAGGDLKVCGWLKSQSGTHALDGSGTDTRPAADRAARTAGLRTAVLCWARGGPTEPGARGLCRDVFTGRAGRVMEAPAAGPEDDDTDGTAISGCRATLDQDTTGPFGPAAPIFPALDRVIGRRGRLSALLSTRCRANCIIPPAPSPSPEQPDSASSPPSGPMTAAGPSGSAMRPACSPVVGADADQAASRASSREGCARPDVPMEFAASPAAGCWADSISNGGQEQLASGRAKVPRDDAAVASAAAAGKVDGTGAASDAYAMLRAWRARRAAAAALVCKAARRFLDARAAAEEVRVEAARSRLAVAASARLLATWRLVCTRRHCLRQRYTGLAALSKEARKAAQKRAYLASEPDLADVDPGLVSKLAAVCYMPAGAAEGSEITAARPSKARELDNSSSGHYSGNGMHAAAQVKVQSYGLVRAAGWGAVAASHRRYCGAAAVEEGRYGLAAAHRRWWLLRKAWCVLAMNAVAPPL